MSPRAGSAPANGIDIAYEVGGSGEPLLLIMGLGGQLTDWHAGFVQLLEERFQVIRFDNRDTGLSTYSQAPVPSRKDLIRAALLKGPAHAPYLLDDMAADAHGLLQALDIERAHVVGMSMGGMIAQLLALRASQTVASLCCIMSNTGDRRNGLPRPRVLAQFARRGQPSRDDALDVTMQMFELVGGLDWDADEQRTRSSASIERAYNPAGVLRHAQATAASADRTSRLRSIDAPTLVMHGLADPLVRPSGGIATSRAMPGSRLLMFPGMGHDLPATRHHEMVAAIVANTHRNR